MAIYDLYSRRRQRELQQEPDVFVYDEVPSVLRGQIAHIWKSAIGKPQVYDGVDWRNTAYWSFGKSTLCRERVVENLTNEKRIAMLDCVNYLKLEPNVDLWLDIVEISFDLIQNDMVRATARDRHELQIDQSPQDAVDELNERFRLAAFGYRFENGRIVRIDSEFVHAEIVKPSLALLSDKRFKAPQDEYLAAHEHYRAGRNAEAVTNANNAFESTMKVICDLKSWQFEKGARASDLVKIMRAKGLLPGFTEKAFDNFVSTLKNGLPEVRNNAGGHGKGNGPATPPYFAAYALHLAAANIVLLVEAFQASEKTA